MPSPAPPEDDPKKLPDHLRPHIEALAPILKAAGITIPEGWEDRRAMPEIYVKERVSVMARKMADNFRGSGVYRTGQEVVRINREEARMEVIKAPKMVSYAEDHMVFFELKQDGTKLVSLGRQRAEEVMMADHFLAKLPVLLGINPIKLPVRRKDGSMALLGQGYDEESKIYTMEGGIDYAEDWELGRAVKYLAGLLRHFPWLDEQAKTNHIAAMLTVFCAGMLPVGARPPVFIYNANLVGSGKTRLAQMCLVPVYGPAETTTWMPNEDEFKKTLDSYAQAVSPYLFLDDNEGFLKSKFINQWATSSRWAGRVLGSKDKFVMPLRAITFITGNNLTLTGDLERRRVAIELLAHFDCNERKLPTDAPRITEEWLSTERNRSDILSALYAHVREAEAVRGEPEERQKILGELREPLSSFEAWSALVPFITQAVGYGDPLIRVSTAEGSASGDPNLTEAKKLARAVLDEIVGDRVAATVPLRDVIPLARRHECFLDILGDTEGVIRDLERSRGGFRDIDVEEPGTDSLGNPCVHVRRRAPTEAEKRAIAEAHSDRATDTKFGMRFKRRVLSLHITGANGRAYEFGTQANKRTSVLTITAVKDPA